MKYIIYRQIETAVRHFARERGFTGDIFGEVPPLGTQRQEWAIVDIKLDVLGELPVPQPNKVKNLISRLVRAAVLGSGQQPRGKLSTPNTDAKLARERRRAVA